jgi:hypothetical protein
MIIEKYGIKMRLVTLEDVNFIYSLRHNKKLGQYISKTHGDIDKQINWINEYKIREAQGKEFYFIAIDDQANKYGVYRIYNFTDNSFESGSWLFSENAPVGMSILSSLVGRDYGFEVLGFQKCCFNVKKRNLAVINYANRFEPTIIKEDNETIWFELTYENYLRQRERLLRMFVK